MTSIAKNYRHKITASAPRRFNLKYLNIGLFAGAAVLGVSYLVNISNLTVKGFALRDLKSQVAVLESEKMTNEEVVNSAQSYYSLNSRAGSLNMVTVSNVEYLPSNGLTVAKK